MSSILVNSATGSGEVPATKPAPSALWEGAIADPAPEALRSARSAPAAHPLPIPAPLSPPRRRTRRLLMAALQLVVLGISALAIWLLLAKVQLSAVLGEASDVSWQLIALVILLNIPTTLLRALRSQLLMRRLGHRVPFLRMNGVDLAGQTLSWITPAASGDLSRPYLWRNHDRVPVSTGVAVVVYERLVTIVQLGVVGGVLAALIYLPLGWFALVAVSGLVILAAPWWLSLAARRWAPRRPASTRPGLVSGLLRSLGQLEHLGLSGRLTALFAACTMLVLLISGLQVGLLAWGMGAGPGLGVVIAAYCLSQVAGSLSTLPFGIGAADVVTIALLAAGGMTHDGAVTVTLLVRLVMTLPLGVAGAVGILVLGRPRIAEESAAEAAVP